MAFDIKKGVTLIEILVVIAIIGVLASILLAFFNEAKEKAYMSVALAETDQMNTALMLYEIDNNTLPEDTDRGECPAGIEKYMNEKIWSSGPWPGSVYDWDNWSAPGYPPHEEIHQISIRFCDTDGNNCNYPNKDWARDFNPQSSVFWCIEGPCRSHESNNMDHPGYCLNCKEPLPPYGF